MPVDRWNVVFFFGNVKKKRKKHLRILEVKEKVLPLHCQTKTIGFDMALSSSG